MHEVWDEGREGIDIFCNLSSGQISSQIYLMKSVGESKGIEKTFQGE